MLVVPEETSGDPQSQQSNYPVLVAFLLPRLRRHVVIIYHANGRQLVTSSNTNMYENIKLNRNLFKGYLLPLKPDAAPCFHWGLI